MEDFRVFRYVKKFLPAILIICLLASFAVYFGLSSSNQYVASEVIHFNDSAAEQGLTPSGDKLDVNEIKSSAVMSKVISRLNLSGEYSVDKLISRVTITDVPDEDKVAQKEAALEAGEEYVYTPSTFIVSFAATNSEGAAFARQLLDEILDVYFQVYSQNYLNVATANNNLEKIYDDNYDYIEMVELIDTNIESTLNNLYKRMDATPYFRSTATETSFNDLMEEFNYIQQVKVSDLFARIYKYQLTKSKLVLISDYATRIDSNNISNSGEEKMIEDILVVIDAYVEKMRNSDNTNITYEYILDDVYDKNLTDGNGNLLSGGDQTVTYDELIFGWRDHQQNKAYAIIDSAYCQYVINTFSTCTGACQNGECAASSQTCTQLHNSDYEALEAELEADIREIVDELSALYELITATNDEYNEYLGASNISVLSSVSVSQSINVKLYTFIAFVFLVIICCGGAILLGRLNDIVNYAFYTDHLTGMNNRSFFDKYLKSMDKMILDDGTVFATVDITNTSGINACYGRKVGDETLKLFASGLKEAFSKTSAKFIYNGNSHFVVLVEKSDYIIVEDILVLFRTRLDNRDSLNQVDIEYKIGIAESFRSKIQSARVLLSEAIKNQKPYRSNAAE